MDRKPLDYARRPYQRRGWWGEWWEWVVFGVIIAGMLACMFSIGF